MWCYRDATVIGIQLDKEKYLLKRNLVVEIIKPADQKRT